MKNFVKNKPKVTLILDKKGQVIHLYPSIRKTKKFLNAEAKSFLKNDYLITLRVTYGHIIDINGKRILSRNEGTYKELDDLKWAFNAFIIEYLS